MLLEIPVSFPFLCKFLFFLLTQLLSFFRRQKQKTSRVEKLCAVAIPLSQSDALALPFLSLVSQQSLVRAEGGAL